MTTQINFNFTDKTALKFKFDLTDENVDQIAAAITRDFEKRGYLLQTKAAKYFKRSAVLSHRKFSMDIFLNNKYVKTIYTGLETSNKLIQDTAALQELLTVLCFEVIDLQLDELIETVAE